uniref:Uncharacterized protein n=1 Tax=Spongospora subterranea TaxID=70186 RepID=A0A0H5R9H1_9EUKA|eukprot:CRZ10775.1 hypothetical protein [Spongospora subterranea]
MLSLTGFIEMPTSMMWPTILYDSGLSTVDRLHRMGCLNDQAKIWSLIVQSFGRTQRLQDLCRIIKGCTTIRVLDYITHCRELFLFLSRYIYYSRSCSTANNSVGRELQMELFRPVAQEGCTIVPIFSSLC